MKNKKVLVLGDIHFPYQHPDFFKFLIFMVKKESPDIILSVGDLVDLHKASMHAKSTKGGTLLEEIHSAKKEIKKLIKLVPNLLITIGNHDSRVARLAETMGIDSSLVKSIHEIFELPKTWILSKKIEIDKVIYTHGDLKKEGPKTTDGLMNYYNQSIVHGHVHSQARIIYKTIETRNIWGFNVGCLINQYSFAFDYSKEKTSVIGIGVIENGIPHFYPMVMDKNNKWRGY